MRKALTVLGNVIQWPEDLPSNGGPVSRLVTASGPLSNHYSRIAVKSEGVSLKSLCVVAARPLIKEWLVAV